jgi:hypothetical protein
MTLILQGTDNSVSSPAVQGGTAGATTGEYFPATNQWAVATNGTQAVLIDSAQKVGIGTSPSYVLDILNANAILRLNSNSNSNGAQLVLGTGVGTLTSTQTIYYDGAFAIAKAYSGTTLAINANGYVTMPSQPSFLACSNSGDTTVTAGTAIPLNVAGYNVGSCYNTSTYRFTAPIAGKYAFTSSVYYTNSGGNTQSMQVAPFVNGGQYIPSGGGDAILFSTCTPNSTGGTIGIGGAVISNLAANDYVTMAARGTNGRFYLGHTSFSGQLIS